MGTWSKVSITEISNNRRIDSEFFHPKYLNAESIVNRHDNVIALGKIGKFIIGPFGSAFHVKNYDSNSEYRYVRGKDVKPFTLLDDDNVYMPKIDFIRLNKYCLKQDDLLISVVGTLGNVAIVPEGVKGIFSCKSTVFRDSSVDPYYLLAYFNSNYGKECLLRRQRGAIQAGLNKEDLKTVPVPIFSFDKQSEIAKNVKKSLELKNHSQTLYQQATALLEQELGLDNFEKDKSKFRITKLSELSGSFRFDSQCFKPEYLQYEEYIRNNNSFDKLTSLLTSVTKGNQQDISDNGKYPYMSIKDISGIDIISKGKVTTPASMAYKDDLLLAVTGATIGKIGIVYRDNTMSFSGDVVSLRVNKEKISPWYLLAILNSQIGQTQFNRWITGSTNGHLSPSDLRKVIVPRLDSTIELLIEEKLKKAIELSISSENLLQEAKNRVEQLIEAAANQ